MYYLYNVFFSPIKKEHRNSAVSRNGNLRTSNVAFRVVKRKVVREYFAYFFLFPINRYADFL